MRQAGTEIAVIGAGVIGLAVAERLLAEGREVVLIDPGAPGMGASYGNAGTIADYAVAPVGTPDVLRNLPSLLFNKASPLAIRPGGFPALLPWLLRFARHSLPGPAARNAQAIAALLKGAGPLWQDLAARIGAADILQPRGCLYLYGSDAEAQAAEAEMARRRDLGRRLALWLYIKALSMHTIKDRPAHAEDAAGFRLMQQGRRARISDQV